MSSTKTTPSSDAPSDLENQLFSLSNKVAALSTKVAAIGESAPIAADADFVTPPLAPVNVGRMQISSGQVGWNGVGTNRFGGMNLSTVVIPGHEMGYSGAGVLSCPIASLVSRSSGLDIPLPSVSAISPVSGAADSTFTFVVTWSAPGYSNASGSGSFTVLATPSRIRGYSVMFTLALQSYERKDSGGTIRASSTVPATRAVPYFSHDMFGTTTSYSNDFNLLLASITFNGATSSSAPWVLSMPCTAHLIHDGFMLSSDSPSETSGKLKADVLHLSAGLKDDLKTANLEKAMKDAAAKGITNPAVGALYALAPGGAFPSPATSGFEDGFGDDGEQIFKASAGVNNRYRNVADSVRTATENLPGVGTCDSVGLPIGDEGSTGDDTVNVALARANIIADKTAAAAAECVDSFEQAAAGKTSTIHLVGGDSADIVIESPTFSRSLFAQYQVEPHPTAPRVSFADLLGGADVPASDVVVTKYPDLRYYDASGTSIPIAEGYADFFWAGVDGKTTIYQGSSLAQSETASGKAYPRYRPVASGDSWASNEEGDYILVGTEEADWRGRVVETIDRVAGAVTDLRAQTNLAIGVAASKVSKSLSAGAKTARVLGKMTKDLVLDGTIGAVLGKAGIVGKAIGDLPTVGKIASRAWKALGSTAPFKSARKALRSIIKW